MRPLTSCSRSGRAERAWAERPPFSTIPLGHPENAAELPINLFVDPTANEKVSGVVMRVALGDVVLSQRFSAPSRSASAGSDVMGRDCRRYTWPRSIPLDVLRPPEVALGLSRERGNGEDLIVGERGLARLVGGYGNLDGPVRPLPMRDGLFDDFPIDDLTGARDVERVGVDVTRDERRSHAVRRGDDAGAAAARHRIRAERDSGGVGVDHPLDDDGGAWGGTREPTLAPIRGDAIARGRAPHVLNAAGTSPDVTYRSFVLARDECSDAVLLGGGRSARRPATRRSARSRTAARSSPSATAARRLTRESGTGSRTMGGMVTPDAASAASDAALPPMSRAVPVRTIVRCHSERRRESLGSRPRAWLGTASRPGRSRFLASAGAARGLRSE